MKLHLGCGNMYLKGYVNVDCFDMVVGDTSRAGCRYDVKANILTLPFKENTVSRILMIHVLEHFYRWETLSLIKDFYRVLKKHSLLYIEMPDLDKCIEWYMKDGRLGGKTIKTPLGRLNKGFTQLYGNQWSGLVYEVHKYVWSKSEIVEVLSPYFEVKDINNKPKYHMKDRDMQIIAVVKK